MADVGVTSNYIDTQDVSLTNVTDNKTYVQLLNVKLILDNKITKHQLTDDTIDNIYSLNMITIEGTMILTRSEWDDLVTNYIEKDKDEWSITWTDGTSTDIINTIKGQLKMLNPIDDGDGALLLAFRIEGDETIGVS